MEVQEERMEVHEEALAVVLAMAEGSKAAVWSFCVHMKTMDAERNGLLGP